MGTFICIECAGALRMASIVLSQAWVRSVTMDTWSESHLRYVQLGGNKQAFASFKPNSSYKYFTVKYLSNEAAQYATRMRQVVHESGVAAISTLHSFPVGVVDETIPTGYSATFLLKSNPPPQVLTN